MRPIEILFLAFIAIRALAGCGALQGPGTTPTATTGPMDPEDVERACVVACSAFEFVDCVQVNKSLPIGQFVHAAEDLAQCVSECRDYNAIVEQMVAAGTADPVDWECLAGARDCQDVGECLQ